MCYQNSGISAKNLLLGVQIEEPEFFIPWSIKENDFLKAFQTNEVRKVVEGCYFVKDVTFLSENCNMGVEFRQNLYRIAFSRDTYSGQGDYGISFANFQTALENTFGKPTKRSKTKMSFDDCEWIICNRIMIKHCIINRFGYEEHLYIECLP